MISCEAPEKICGGDKISRALRGKGTETAAEQAYLREEILTR